MGFSLPNPFKKKKGGGGGILGDLGRAVGVSAAFNLVGGSGLFGINSLMQSSTEAENLREQIRETNKQIKSILAETKRQADIFQTRSQFEIGQQKSAFAKAGVDLEGSPLALLASSEKQIAEDVKTIMLEGEQRARALKIHANNLDREKDAVKQAAPFRAFSAAMQPVSLLTSVMGLGDIGSLGTAPSGGGGGSFTAPARDPRTIA